MNHALDEAILLQTSRRSSNGRRECLVTRALGSLNEQDREDMRAVLENSGIWNTTIAELFTRRKVQMSEKTVRNHRKGDCGCSK